MAQPGPGNLPHDVTTFVGRSDQLRRLHDALQSSRLVTLVGPGGVGKSRLAIALGRKHARAFRDGVWFAGLDPVNDRSLVGHAIAAALDLEVPSTHDPEEVLRGHLAHRRMLVVIDNCEHLVDPVRRLISSVLRVAPEVQIVTTSRIPLGITGETVWQVPPLAVAEAGEDGALADGGPPTEALALLADRAASVAPGLTLDAGDALAAEVLCRKLDGLPLAIELAATRLRVMSVEQLLEALDDRFDVLDSGMADAPQRQRSLRAAVEWSYELCSDQERDLWANLSILPGSFDIELAARLSDLSRGQLFRTLGTLTDLSVVSSEHAGGTVRFRMLETLREFGRERAAQAGVIPVLRERLCHHYLEIAVEAADQNLGSGQAAWIRRMRDDRPNLWAAIDVALHEPPPSTTALRICGALWFLWVSGSTGEGRYWLDRALARHDAATADRAAALWAAGYVSLTAGDLAHARELLDDCGVLARQLGETALAAQAAQLLGVTSLFANDLEQAIERLDEAVTFLAAADVRHPASVLAVGQLGVAMVLRGDVERGNALARDCVRLADETGELWCRSWGRWLHAIAMWFAGDVDAASESLATALQGKAELDDRVGIAACLEIAAWIAQSDGHLARSATLTGASRRIWQRTRGNRLFGFAALLDGTRACEAAARAAMGASAYDERVAEGARLDEPAAVALALGQHGAAPAPEGLTRRESEVARLVSRGLTNRQIAEELVIAPRTAESHVEHIRLKLGVTSRTQIAAWVLERHG